MIINLRGPNAAGKTTIARDLMARAECRPVRLKPGGRPIGYAGPAPWRLEVLGSYENACGGCDTIRTVQEVIDRTERAMHRGANVLFEGILISTTFGAIGTWAQGLKFPPVLFAFLDTPMEVCLDRLEKRRAESGRATKPLNLENVKAKWHQNARLVSRFREAGLKVTILDWQRPVDQLWGEFGW